MKKQFIVFIWLKRFYECIINRVKPRKGIYRQNKTYPTHNRIVVSNFRPTTGKFIIDYDDRSFLLIVWWLLDCISCNISRIIHLFITEDFSSYVNWLKLDFTLFRIFFVWPSRCIHYFSQWVMGYCHLIYFNFHILYFFPMIAQYDPSLDSTLFLKACFMLLGSVLHFFLILNSQRLYSLQY